MDAALDVGRAETLVRESLSLGGHALLRVTGDCLEPSVAAGERVRLVSSASCAPRFGDVVLARLPEGLRLHRLVWPLPGFGGRHLRTKADRAPFLDAAIPNAAVLATVLDVERGTAVLATRDVGRAWRSLGAAILTRIRLALGAWLD